MKISEEVANVLSNSTVDNNMLYLPQTQLERNLYLTVNKVLISLGGKWNRKAKCHIFDKPVDDIIEEVILTGEYLDQKKEYQFFETPNELAEKIVKMANINKGDTVLEPSAGRGRIASLVTCSCIEHNPDNRKYLEDNGFCVVGDDFLLSSKEYDVIVANPPFSKQQDIDHITHMIKLAKKTVVSIASASILFRTNKKTEEFRNLVYSYGGSITALPDKSFSTSGTNVSTCIVCVNK